MTLRSTLQKRPRRYKYCFWCGEMCPANEPRIEAAWVFEGDFQMGHYHLECDAAMHRWWKENRGECEGPEPHQMQRGKTVYQGEEVSE